MDFCDLSQPCVTSTSALLTARSIVSCCCSMDRLFQYAPKPVHLFSKYHVKFGNRRTDDPRTRCLDQSFWPDGGTKILKQQKVTKPFSILCLTTSLQFQKPDSLSLQTKCFRVLRDPPVIQDNKLLTEWNVKLELSCI